MTEITLSIEELFLAQQTGGQRQYQSMLAGHQNTGASIKETWLGQLRNHVLGAAGEIAYAKFRNAYWALHWTCRYCKHTHTSKREVLVDEDGGITVGQWMDLQDLGVPSDYAEGLRYREAQGLLEALTLARCSNPTSEREEGRP